MGTCYSSVTKNHEKPKKSIQQICRDAAMNGNLNIIKNAYEEGNLNNSELLEQVFRLSAKHNNLDIIKWGFEKKILDNMENILHIASINEYSMMIEYLIFNYHYDNINIYNTFIISALKGNNYIIELLDDNYEINDITYITAYLGAYKNNWGTCTKFISDKINKSHFNSFIIIEDKFVLKEKIEIFFNIFYKKINKYSEENRVKRNDISYPTGDIIIEYYTKYPGTKDSEEDVYNIFINYILYLFLAILFYFICIYLYLFYLFVVICIYFYLFIFL